MTGDTGGGSAPERAASQSQPQLALVYRKVLAGEIGLTPVWFDQHVLDRYRETAGYRVIRTNSAGRLRGPGNWTLDFGISDGDRLIHASAADLGQRLPPAERQHWLGFVVAPPVSGTFLVMRMGAGHCMDDGDVRAWPG